MAYTLTPDPFARFVGADGVQYFTIRIAETNIDVNSEWAVTGLPLVCTLISYHAVKTGGSMATMQPILGRSAGFTTTGIDYITGQSAAGTSVNDDGRVVLPLTGGALYGRTQPNVGADNNVSTILVLREGN